MVLPKSDNGFATAVAAVLSNWHNVLRAINMASSRHPYQSTLATAILNYG